MRSWRFWESWGQPTVDLAEVDRELERAKIIAKVKDADADLEKRKMYRHRTENHFSELVAHVLRGDE